MPYETPVIPAKAGIQSVDRAFPKVYGMDSRFRGNDFGVGHPSLANDTTNLFPVQFGGFQPEWYTDVLGVIMWEPTLSWL